MSNPTLNLKFEFFGSTDECSITTFGPGEVAG